MPTAIDLTLPASNDHAIDRNKFNNHTKQCCAIYFHVALPLSAMTDLIALCNSQLMTSGSDVMCPAPNSDKVGRPLRSSYEAHRNMGTTGVFHPWYYIAVVERDFEQFGVLLIHNGTAADPTIRKMWVPAQAAGAAFANVQVAHMDWVKLEAEFSHLQMLESDSDSQSDDMDAPVFPDYAIGIYILYPVSEDAVLNALGRKSSAHAHTIFPYGIQGHIAPSSPDASTFTLHSSALISDKPTTGSSQCSLDAYDQRAVTFAITEYMAVDERAHAIHESMFLIADREDVEQDGLLLVRINRHITDPVVFEAQRVPASNPDTLQLFTKIDKGLRPFHISHWSFVLQCKHEEDAWRIAELMDPEHAERLHGDEKVVVVSEPGEHMAADGPATVDTAVQPWPVVCHHERFRHNMHKHLFVYGDAGVKTREDEVIIVDEGWEANEEDIAKGVQGLEIRNHSRTTSVPVGEAYEMLCRMADGVTE